MLTSTLVLLLSASVATAGSVSSQSVYKITNLPQQSKNVSLHLFPTVHSPTLAQLGLDDKWLVRKKGARIYKHSRWQEVEWNGKRGWIQKQYLTEDKQASLMASRDRTCLTKRLREVTCKNRFAAKYPNYFSPSHISFAKKRK